RNSGLPLVRPAPPTRTGAPADRGGSGQLHTGDRAAAGPGRGAATAPGRGTSAGGHQGGTRRDLPAELLAAAGRDVRRAPGLRGPYLPVPRAGPAHRP